MTAFRHIRHAVDLGKVDPDIVQYLLHRLGQHRVGRGAELAFRQQTQEPEDPGGTGRFSVRSIRIFQFIQQFQQFLPGLPGKMQDIVKILPAGKGQQRRILGTMEPETKPLMERRSPVNADVQFTGPGDDHIPPPDRVQQVIDQERHISRHIHIDLIAVMDMGSLRVVRPVRFLLMGEAVLKGHHGPGRELNILRLAHSFHLLIENSYFLIVIFYKCKISCYIIYS